jgi:glutathione reductase (NADPH)
MRLALTKPMYFSYFPPLFHCSVSHTQVHRISGHGKLVAPGKVQVGDQTLTANHIVVAVGGQPNSLNIPGEENAIDSDKFFELTTQPKKVAVIGAGYIAVELAGVFNGLGTDTTLFVRKEMALRNFDTTIATYLDTCMKKSGSLSVSLSLSLSLSRHLAFPLPLLNRN